jgi:hypothetical protein
MDRRYEECYAVMNDISKLFTQYIYKNHKGLIIASNSEDEANLTNNTNTNTNKLSSSFNTELKLEENNNDNSPHNQDNVFHLPSTTMNNITSQQILLNTKSNEISETDSEVDLNNLTSFWKFKIENTSKQINPSDCGIFVCKFMDYISRNKKITFTHEDMNYFRILIGIELMEGKLLNN